MKRRGTYAWALVVGAALTVGIAIVLGGAAAPAQAGSPEDAVLDWNQYASEALINAPAAPTPGMG